MRDVRNNIQSPNYCVSVLMPTYNQGHFISRAIKSLQLQTFQNWELVIINDRATDYTDDIVTEYLADKRIKYFKNESNKGLGYSLNKGLRNASNNLIAYLPSDDIYFEDHLQNLYDTISSDDNCALAYSGMQHNYTNSNFSHSAQETLSFIGGWYQLVQVIHRKTGDEWMTRDTLVTDCRILKV